MNFKLFNLFLASFLCFSTAFAQSEKKMMKQAKSYAKGMEKGDWEKVVELTYPEIVKLAGGEKRYIQQSKNSALLMERQGFTIDAAELSSPSDTVSDGGKLLRVIPMRLTFDGPLGKLYSESSILGISIDAGASWTFISVSQTGLEDIVKLFPEATRKLAIPTKKVYQDN